MRRSLAAALTALVAPLAAQTDRDDFNYPNGTVIPGWTQQRGVWQVINGRIATTSGATWSYITKDGIVARNCVLDGDFYFVGSGVQFAGLTARHQGGNQDANLLMVKIQNNGGANDFDRIFGYERPGASLFADIPGGVLQATCRMITLDGQFWMEVDTDLDGIFDLSLPPLSIATMTSSGLVGMNGFQTSEMDNFEFFDAVLVPLPAVLPRIGTTYVLQLDTPSPQVPWVGMLSLGNYGIPLDAPRGLPLSLDPLFTASLSVGLSGATDGAGKATLNIPIPNNTFLVGLDVFAGAVTIDLTKPFAIGHIANESHFKIQS